MPDKKSDDSKTTISGLNNQVLELNQEIVLLREQLNKKSLAEQNNTEQKNQEKQLHFQDLANNAPVMIWIIDENAECTYINKQWCDYTGTTLEGNLNKGWLSGIHPDDVISTRNSFVKASKNQNDFTVDYRLRRFDGQYRWMAVSGMPRFNNNKFLGYIGTVTDIDDRKKIAEQLKESEEAFRTLAETIPNFVWTTDPNGQLDYYNSKFIDYVGAPVEEIRKMGWKIFVHSDDLPRCLVLWEYALRTGKSFEYESRYRRNDGQYRWFIARAVPLYDDDKNIIKWYVTCSDIHEQKRIEQFLEKQVKQVESEVYIEKNKLRSVFMNAPAVISVMNGPEHIYEFYNAKIDQILNREDVIGKTVREAQPELENTDLFEILDEVYKTGKPFIGNEIISDTGDGKLHYFNFIYQPIFNDKNQVEGVTTFGFEVTEQVFARQKVLALVDKLKESEAKYRALAESLEIKVEERTNELLKANKEIELQRFKLSSLLMTAPAIVNLFRGPEHIFELVNNMFQDIYPNKEFIDKTIREAQPELENQGLIKILDEVYKTGIPFIGKEALVETHSDHGIKGSYFNFVYQPIFDIDKKVYGISSFANDVTEEVVSRQKIEKMAKELEYINIDLKRSNEDLQQFAYIASHDLCSPLRSISGYMEILSRRYKDKLDDDGKRFISSAINGAKKMQNLIDDLLYYSRVSSGELNLVTIDCEQILDEVLTNLKDQIEERNVVINSDKLPEVIGKETFLVRLFQNLISNAIKFNENKPVKVNISVEKNNHQWIFCIADNGIGIDQKHQEKIFQIFQRLHTDAEYNGTGIGLAVCKKIIEKHNGTIWLESEKNKGTKFYFTMPVIEEQSFKN